MNFLRRNSDNTSDPLPDLVAIKRALGDLSKRRDRLSKAAWVESSCLIGQYTKEYPAALVAEAVVAVFNSVLAALERETPDWADLLRGRFWEGELVARMLSDERPQPWSQTLFFEQQALAISRFLSILQEMETRCRDQRAKDHLLLPVTVRPPRSFHERPHVVVGWVAGVLLLIIVLLGLWGTQPLAPSGAVALAPTHTPTSRPVCGEIRRATPPAPPAFLRQQGVSAFTFEGTGGLIHNNKTRAVALNNQGLWAGFFATSDNPRNGLAQSNKPAWADCDSPDGTLGKDVNDIAFDHEGRVWVAAEKTGVAMYDGDRWHTFTEKDGLPSADTFGLTVDARGSIWVCTWSGVATYNGTEWSTPYTTQNGTLASDHTHAVAFDSVGDVWVGLIRDGVSRRRHTDGSWIHITKEDGSLSGNEVRAILVRPQKEDKPESVWIATNDGGISVYDRGSWSHHTADTGLPNNVVNDLALDRYNRVWAATGAGVSYLVGDAWTTYTTLPSLSIAIGADCPDCPYDSDHVLVGTLHNGITHSRLPLDTSAVEVLKEVYPKVVAPGERFVPEITIAPKAPYKLDSNRGDFLSNTDEDDALLFGTHEHIAVKGVIEPGAAFTFREPDLPFIAPDLPDGVAEKTYTSTWRMWMHTRYVGPPIHITFTVRRNSKLH